MREHFSNGLAEKLAREFNIDGLEIKEAINEYCKEQKANIWTIREVIEYAGNRLSLPANNQIAGEAMELATGGFFKVNGKINWNPLETALDSVLKTTFKAFHMTKKDGDFVITGIARDPNRVPNPDDIRVYDSKETAQDTLRALNCISTEFELKWDGQMITDPFADDAFPKTENDDEDISPGM